MTNKVGMFDKDKEIGVSINDVYPIHDGTRESDMFVVWGASVDAEPVTTKTGEATKTRLVVSDVGRDEDEDRHEVTTLSRPISEMAANATPEDFPAVCKLLVVFSDTYKVDATVLRYIKNYESPNVAPMGATKRKR